MRHPQARVRETLNFASMCCVLRAAAALRNLAYTEQIASEIAALGVGPLVALGLVLLWVVSVVHKLALAGLYRRRFWAASAAGRHDYYLMMDNDVNVSREALEALCVHSRRLADRKSVV